jgi:hypothetical protein
MKPGNSLDIHSVEIPLRGPSSSFWRRFMRPLIANLGTVLIVVALLFLNNTFATSLRLPGLSSSSTSTIGSGTTA